ncbi:hypothetical protein, partial [Hymenobacter coccineus]|uniref:hypothetical protein n=1 Tax=Hymenobacter coccineus TaxID=1908235 RepID=UPI001301921B
MTQPGFSFEQCRVYGAFVHGCAAASAAEATRFTGCTFADRPYAGRPALSPGLLLPMATPAACASWAAALKRRTGPCCAPCR